MSEKVSTSATGQDLPKPTREERDEAYSSGAGRKAKELTKPELPLHAPAKTLEPPVGLDLETKGDEEAKEVVKPDWRQHVPAKVLAARVGLDLETKGDDEPSSCKHAG